MSDIQRDREERQRVIEILQKEKKTALHDNRWAFDYAIASIKTDLRYDLLYEETSGQKEPSNSEISNKSEIPTGSTTKDYLGVDYLGVDCISRSDVLKLMQDNWHTHNGDWAMQESMDDIRALPAVTPIRPKGHWMPSHIPESILDECSECGFSCGAFPFNYCPNCGAKMVEPQESEDKE